MESEIKDKKLLLSPKYMSANKLYTIYLHAKDLNFELMLNKTPDKDINSIEITLSKRLAKSVKDLQETLADWEKDGFDRLDEEHITLRAKTISLMTFIEIIRARDINEWQFNLWQSDT